jgi:tripartite-type tricarboxylate transporter receptor subunit TctC
MKLPRRQFLHLAAGAAALGIVSTSVWAQNWPARPITMVIPFAAGGPTDLFGRIVGQRLGEILGQPVVIENIGGAGGMSGSKRVAEAAADGYTILLGTVGDQAQSQSLFKRPLYNSTTDFTPVALLTEAPLVLVARKDLPAQDFKEFVSYTRANQGKMQYGSAGAGAPSHIGCLLLNYIIGTNVVHVPYRGTAPAMQDLQGGRIDFLCDVISTAKPQIEAGSVKGLAILDGKRSPALPSLATTEEQGTKVEAYTWHAIFLPKNAPAPVVAKLNSALTQAVKSPTVRDRLSGLGVQVVADDLMTPEYLRSFLESEIAKWAAPIKSAGLTMD